MGGQVFAPPPCWASLPSPYTCPPFSLGLRSGHFLVGRPSANACPLFLLSVRQGHLLVGGWCVRRAQVLTISLVGGVTQHTTSFLIVESFSKNLQNDGEGHILKGLMMGQAVLDAWRRHFSGVAFLLAALVSSISRTLHEAHVKCKLYRLLRWIGYNDKLSQSLRSFESST